MKGIGVDRMRLLLLTGVTGAAIYGFAVSILMAFLSVYAESTTAVWQMALMALAIACLGFLHGAALLWISPDRREVAK